MKILFTFENPLPSAEADAEVFSTTAKYLAPLLTDAWLHVPLAREGDRAVAEGLAGMPVVKAWAPTLPAFLRHFCCGLTLPLRREFRAADLVYTRNLWIAWISIRFGQRVAFDHYRPWPDQIPPLRRWLYGLLCHPRFLVKICHSDYTRRKYLELGIPADKLHTVRNGFEPRRLASPVPLSAAKAAIGVPPERKTVVYTGRINHKKGLYMAVEAAKRLPDLLFILVGSYGHGPIERAAEGVENVRIVPYQPADRLADYIFAADVLLIPPSLQPLAEFGSTVLPLKLFFYMASGRPILAGDTPDVRELLRHGENAVLSAPDAIDALVATLRDLTASPETGARLAAQAQADSRGLTWEARAARIAALVTRRLQPPPGEHGGWSRPQSQAWREQSRRWLAHLVAKGSPILPPAE